MFYTKEAVSGPRTTLWWNTFPTDTPDNSPDKSLGPHGLSFGQNQGVCVSVFLERHLFPAETLDQSEKFCFLPLTLLDRFRLKEPTSGGSRYFLNLVDFLEERGQQQVSHITEYTASTE